MAVRTYSVQSLEEIKQEVMTKRGILCPVTLEPLSINESKLFFHNGKEWVISNIGLKHLREIYGDKYIDNKIVEVVADPYEGYD